MNQDTKDFIETWNERISAMQGNSLGSVFDRYTTLYTLYNRIYNESFRQLKFSNNLAKPRYSDFEKATALVVQLMIS